MIEADPSLLNRGDGKNAAIHSAASNDQAEIVTYLVEVGADVNAKDEDGMTALHRAAEGHHFRAASALINQGAALNEFDARGYTPTLLALLGRSEEGRRIAKALLESRASLGLVDACALANAEQVNAILAADPRAIDNIPSHEMLISATMAIDYGSLTDRVAILDMLIANGLKPDKDFVRAQIDSLISSNMVGFIPALSRYTGDQR